MTVYDARPIGLEYNYNQVCDIMQLFGEAQNNTAVMVDHIHPATEAKWIKVTRKISSPVYNASEGKHIIPFPSDSITFGSVSEILTISSDNQVDEDLSCPEAPNIRACTGSETKFYDQLGTYNKFACLDLAEVEDVVDDEDVKMFNIGDRSLFSLASKQKTLKRGEKRNVETTPDEMIDNNCVVDVVKYETTDRLQILSNNPSKSKGCNKTAKIQSTLQDFQSSIKFKSNQWRRDVHLLVTLRIKQIQEQENDRNREQSTKQDPIIPLNLSPFLLMFVFFNLGHIMKIEKKKHSNKKFPIRPPSSRRFSKKAMEKKIRRLLLLLSNDVESNPGPMFEILETVQEVPEPPVLAVWNVHHVHHQLPKDLRNINAEPEERKKSHSDNAEENDPLSFVDILIERSQKETEQIQKETEQKKKEAEQNKKEAEQNKKDAEQKKHEIARTTALARLRSASSLSLQNTQKNRFKEDKTSERKVEEKFICKPTPVLHNTGKYGFKEEKTSHKTSEGKVEEKFMCKPKQVEQQNVTTTKTGFKEDKTCQKHVEAEFLLKPETLQHRSVSTPALHKTGKYRFKEDQTSHNNVEKKFLCKPAAVRQLSDSTLSLNDKRKDGFREEKTSFRNAEEEVPWKTKPMRQPSVRATSIQNISLDKVRAARSENLNVIDKNNEKKLNSELIENHQENIIEQEEDVPAYKNMPWEETLKPEKARRRLKPEIEGNNQVVHCPYCTRGTRTKKEIMKHLSQIHVHEMLSECCESENISPFSPEYKERLENIPTVHLKQRDENNFEVVFQKNIIGGQAKEHRNTVDAKTTEGTELSSSCSRQGITMSYVAEQTRHEPKSGDEVKTTIYGGEITLDETSFICSSNKNTARSPNVAEIGKSKKGSVIDMIDMNQPEHEQNSGFENYCKDTDNESMVEKTCSKSNNMNNTDMTVIETMLNPSNRQEKTKVDRNTIVSKEKPWSKESGTKESKHQSKETKSCIHNPTNKVNKFYNRDLNPSGKSIDGKSLHGNSPDKSKTKSRELDGTGKKVTDKTKESLKSTLAKTWTLLKQVTKGYLRRPYLNTFF